MNPFYTTLFILLSFFIAQPNSFSQGEPARQEAKINQVYEQFNVSGEGVVIAVIDRGIDYTHTDFLDEGGNTRILFIYDMINPAGANDEDNPFGIGTIFDENEINASLLAGGDPLTMDHFGHGTATTGITGGDGSGTLTAEFHGVAPNATFIIVKAIQNYFPSFDDQPGQNGFYDPTYIPVALDFIASKLAEINKPSVTLLNMGSIGGPTDGTSTITRAMNDFVDTGNTLVCGVGDDGGNDNHAAGTVAQGETIDVKIQKGEAGNLRFELWYEEVDRFEVSITRPNSTIEGPFPAPATADNADDRTLTGINYYHRGANTEFYGATSPRRMLMIDFSGETGEYNISLKGSTVDGSGNFHATLNPSTYSITNKFTSHVVEGSSINDFASAEKVIVPTDYVVKNDWVDMDGNQRQMTGQGNPGELWAGSSYGPTQDDRLGVDFAACGEVLYAAYSPDTWYSHHSWLLLQGGDSKYGIQNAVSAAAPLTTGVIALLLELNSALKPAGIKTILRNTARQDSYTGSVPNNRWGNGKLDALAAAEEAKPNGIFTKENISNSLLISPNPSSESIKLAIIEDQSSVTREVSILNNNGQVVWQSRTFEDHISISQLPGGLYHLMVKTDSKIYSANFVKQ